MSKDNSHADVMTDWEELMQAVQSDPEVQPTVDTDRQSLAQSLTTVQGLKARQNELQGLRQEVTQQLAAELTKGKETAIKIRSMTRGKIGPKSERLVHFKIAPLRKRPRKAKQVVKKPAEEAPGAHPGPSTSSTGGSAA
ncbi:MAG: hypothetical protein DMF53_05525 [Acidobacteria bacterium]|nr:MAG: hypothetical protein DMF53_05525 [Acidobacteriota bacterium]